MNDHDKQKQDEAREILQRVESDSASFVTGGLDKARGKLASHFSADDQHDDTTVKWATRIGRALGLVFFFFLIINLFTRWFF